MISGRWNRREWLGACAAGMLAAQTSGRKKVAALISEYRPNSHADVIVSRLLGGYYYLGSERPSRLELVSMYTDQVPDEDMSRDLAAQYHFKLLPSIREALTMTSNTSTGGRRLAVDGVLLICEHGAYPYNPLGQKLYPRFEFFKQVIDVFRETGQTVPVFSDKHFSYDWFKAKWMYDQARELRVPLMAGSVLPLARDPAVLIAPGTPLERAVLTWSATFFDSKDSYGFHALERLQSMVERREGGETGVAAVTCLEGESVWEWAGQNRWALELLDALPGPAASPMAAKDPLLFLLEYRSGLQAAVFRLNGYPKREAFAAQVRGSSTPIAVNDQKPGPAIAVPPPLTRKYQHNHFSATVHDFEEMVLSGREPRPVERTLLTTGALAALFESSYQPSPMYGRSLQHGTHLAKGRRIPTPHLSIGYRAF